MRRILVGLFLAVAAPAFAQVDVDGTGDGPRIYNPLVPSSISTTGPISATALTVWTRISSTAPQVSGALVYKAASGLVMTSSNTYVSDTGTGNDSLVTANISILSGTISGTNLNPVAQAAAGASPLVCNAANNLRQVVTLTGITCTCVNGQLVAPRLPLTLLGGTNLITGTCPL